MTPAVLELDAVTRHFGDVVALDAASLVVRAGTVHALLGENGAGKTTLMRIAFGLERADAGTIRVDGSPRSFRSPADALATGLCMVHQHFTLVPAMTVLDNVRLGLPASIAVSPDDVRRLSSTDGDALDPDGLVSHLGIRAQQRIELLKARVRNARLIILDEPTAALAPAEVDSLLRWLRDFANRGGSVVLITHRIREALDVADDVTVLRRGRTVWSLPRAGLTLDGVVSAMVGRAAEAITDRRRSKPATESVAILDGVGFTDARGQARLAGVSLVVRRGEVLGIAGVEGSGTHELLRVLARRLPPTQGRLTLPRRIGFVPEDRHREALATSESVMDNVALRDAGDRTGRLEREGLGARARDLVDRHGIVAAGPDAPAWTMSGGNQQRLVIARELDGPTELVVVENPTRGLDVQAATAVRARLRAAAGEGAGIVYWAADLDEVLAMADRIIVMHGGRAIAVVHDRDAVGRAMLGAA